MNREYFLNAKYFILIPECFLVHFFCQAFRIIEQPISSILWLVNVFVYFQNIDQTSYISALVF